ncbi:MAG TPA: STAS domain-containing protein [Usitatibacter sp.]|nr:STAS domain-containing protein [Usitatibacter sp.]
MRVTPRRYASCIVVRAEGRLDHDTCDAFGAQLTQWVDDAARERGTLVLDLSGLEYVSSAGLRCFMLGSRHAKASGTGIVVAALQPMVAEIFAISHFDRLFRVFPDVRAALAEVSGEALAAFDKA